MRVVFALRNTGLLKIFEAPIRGLCEGGDEVVALIDSADASDRSLHPLEQEVEGLTIRPGLAPEAGRLAFEGALRVWIDYLRYFEPQFEEATKYRERCGRPLPESLREETDLAASEAPEVRRALSAGLRAIERSLPVPDDVVRMLRQEEPDAVIVSPLLKRGSPQVAYLRAARRLGIPSALCVASWDNLTTTGVIHEMPDVVAVWNEAQRKEAVSLHGVPPESVAVTGAPRFDEWFDHEPTTTREEYCARLGLPADRPHILYVGSHKFTAPDEAEWISRWLLDLRESGHPELRGVPVVVRPHPAGPLGDGSRGSRRLAQIPGVVVHPPEGTVVVEEAAFSEYFDSLHHAAVVVGINTSAMIEAAVLGRGVHVLLAKRYRTTQAGSVHFDHLRTAGGGLVVATRNREEHALGLARALRGEDAGEAAERARSFLSSFVRPHGLDRPASPLLVETIRALAARPTVAAGPEVGDLADAVRSMLVVEDSSRQLGNGSAPLERAAEPWHPRSGSPQA